MMWQEWIALVLLLVMVWSLFRFLKIAFDEAGVFDHRRGVLLFLMAITFPFSVYLSSKAAQKRIMIPLIVAGLAFGLLQLLLRTR